MYGLPQAGILMNELLQRRLALDEYLPTKHTHGLWKHKTRPVWFSLAVDYFSIKYIGRKNVEHLMTSIKKNYDISSDWTWSAYCGLKLDWDYAKGTVALSMPGYKSRQIYTSTNTQRPYVLIIHRISVLHLQQLGGTLLYYDRSVDPTFIMPVNVLASEQTRTTADTSDKIIKLLNYCTTHPESTLPYHASDMILNIHSDASYLSEREAKSRAGGIFYMGSNTDKTNILTNGEILIISTVFKHVISSAAEAEIGAVFLNAK
jgi:hypothetical protein